MCQSCQKRGDYSSQCFLKSVGSVATALSEINDETASLDTITLSSTTKSCICNVALDEQNVIFKIDTGAEVTVISESVAHQFELKQRKISHKMLCGADHKFLSVLGEVPLTLSYRGKHYMETVTWLKDFKKIFRQFFLFTPQNVPLPLWKMVAEELALLESMGGVQGWWLFESNQVEYKSPLILDHLMKEVYIYIFVTNDR